MLPNTGERLTKELFEELHKSSEPNKVIMFNNTMEAVDSAIVNPLVMVASDGISGHPRNAGTYCRILARYVRDQGKLTLLEAIRKMSLMPAEVLEHSTIEARQKGRLQESADADIVIFDPLTVSDHATYSRPMEASGGVKFVLVRGVPVVQEGKVIDGVFPGKPLLRRPKADRAASARTM
jgi:N-acyl-D-aspartate/D-glutamate deacylase